MVFTLIICLLLVASLVAIAIFTKRLQASLAKAPNLPPISSSRQNTPTISVVIPAYNEEINIRDCVIANLETLEKIIRVSDNPKLIDIKLYDTLPSLAIYRAGNYMLAAPFLHGSLAINTFQFELKVDTSNQLIARTLQNDFELMWEVARQFIPIPIEIGEMT
ncbi:MAG: hypothetical protein HC763_29020 [Hydrococcus sp. CRU_1_1]|nr:hypothetical protein [Hydrococcus sp. CRU_1_1]